jgi:hypothetical protein
MDLTIPYTFYPLALPHWIAWLLFLLAMAGVSRPAYSKAEAGVGAPGWVPGRSAWWASWPRAWSCR